MRALTAKEKKLLLALVGALFVLLNVVGLQAFLNRQRALQSSIVQLQAQLAAEACLLIFQAGNTGPGALSGGLERGDALAERKDFPFQLAGVVALLIEAGLELAVAAAQGCQLALGGLHLRP